MAIRYRQAMPVLSTTVLLLSLGMPVSAGSALTVIYDSGETYSLAPFFEVFDEDTDRREGPLASRSAERWGEGGGGLAVSHSAGSPQRALTITTCGLRRRSCAIATRAATTGGQPSAVTTHPTVHSGQTGTGHGCARTGNA